MTQIILMMTDMFDSKKLNKIQNLNGTTQLSLIEIQAMVK